MINTNEICFAMVTSTRMTRTTEDKLQRFYRKSFQLAWDQPLRGKTTYNKKQKSNSYNDIPVGNARPACSPFSLIVVLEQSSNFSQISVMVSPGLIHDCTY